MLRVERPAVRVTSRGEPESGAFPKGHEVVNRNGNGGPCGEELHHVVPKLLKAKRYAP